jgi:hypothetical protein
LEIVGHSGPSSMPITDSNPTSFFHK